MLFLILFESYSRHGDGQADATNDSWSALVTPTNASMNNTFAAVLGLPATRIMSPGSHAKWLTLTKSTANDISGGPERG
jgi:hypothetical protein